MSSGAGMPWDKAYKIAEQVAAELKPAVLELKCVGSVRRKAQRCGDIEFVCRPEMQPDLMGTGYPILDRLEAVLAAIGSKVKGKDRFIQVVDVLGNPGVKLDLYLCWPPASFGSLVAIRTGPWELSKFAVDALHKHGYRHVDGHIESKETGEIVPSDTEEQFFALCGVPFVVPSKREALRDQLLGRMI